VNKPGTAGEQNREKQLNSAEVELVTLVHLLNLTIEVVDKPLNNLSLIQFSFNQHAI
jgi:hypothetical protein